MFLSVFPFFFFQTATKSFQWDSIVHCFAVLCFYIRFLWTKCRMCLDNGGRKKRTFERLRGLLKIYSI